VKPESALHKYMCTSVLPATRCQRSTCALYTSVHYNRDITVFVNDVHMLMTVVTFTEEIVIG